ncbi:MAG TPA: transposase [Thermoplasmatales archaeon]|nr:transposase [Thermoplasmatales archaeon]HEX16938.1 transposase [Thermoplasmatales archaeon]
MSILILSSTEDPASTNMKRFLLENLEWNDIGEIYSNRAYRCRDTDAFLVTINDPLIYHEEVDEEIREHLGIDFGLMIVLSRHRSKTEEPTLTTHPIGNFGKAEFGGRDKTLVKTSPRMMTQFLRLLKEEARKRKLYHRVSFEVTHHGPFVSTKTFFVEVGSNEREWNNPSAVEAVANSVKELLLNFRSEEDLPSYPVLIGVGGGHYAPRFSDLAFEKRVAFGHMIPNYQVEAGNIDDAMIRKCIDATPGFEGVYIHRKGLKKSRAKELEMGLKEMGVRIYRSDDLEDL